MISLLLLGARYYRANINFACKPYMEKHAVALFVLFFIGDRNYYIGGFCFNVIIAHNIILLEV